MLGTMAVVVFFRWQARSGEKISRAGEGRGLFLAIRLCGLGMLVSTVLILLGPQWITFAKLPLGETARWVGAALGLLNIVFLGWTLRTLGKNLTDTVVTREKHSLVVAGPYRYVRHPFYLAILGAATGLSLLAANWLLLAFGVATFILLLIRSPIEERALEARFGQAYRDYRARTGAIVPRLW